jgi:hypothetical protein
MNNLNNVDFEHLNKLIEKFANLDNEILSVWKSKGPEKGLELLEKTRLCKLEIKRFMSRHENIPAREHLALKIKKIRDNYGYNIDKIYDIFSQKAELSQEDEEGIDYVDALFSEGTADYVDAHFFRRKNEVGSVVLSRNLPEVFIGHLKRLKECYSLGLFEATVIYCRAIIETAAHMYLKKQPKSKSYGTWEKNLRAALREKALKNKVYEYNWKEADKIRELTNDILHGKDDRITISEKEAFECIKSTFAFAEDLF